MKRKNALPQMLKTLFATSLLALTANSYAATWELANCSLGTADAGGYKSCSGVSGVAVRATSTSGSSVVDATVTTWDTGLGVLKDGESASSSGPHSLDNYEGLDALIFKFQNAVSLTSLTLGWNGHDNSTGRYNDSDAAVYAWTGAGAPGNVTSGWTLIDQYFNVGATGTNKGTTSAVTPTFSSYWLVSALGVGGSSSDAFKVFSIAGNVAPPTTGVPEPGSLALLAMGAFGLMAARRRQKNQNI